MPVRVALSALALQPGGGGVSTYIRELLRALPAAIDAEIVAAVQQDVVDTLPPDVTGRPFPVASGIRRAVAAFRPLGPVDLVHGLDATLPLRVRDPSVVTVHDLSVFDIPWTFSRRRAWGKRLQVRHAIRRADAVIAVSEFTAARVREVLGRDAVVVPEAPPSDSAPATPEAIARVRRQYALPDEFVLHVGTVEPRKDVAGLSSACERLDVPLVLAGGGTTGARVDARRLGYVAREHLNALYGAATVVAYPSLYEGFGIPPLEAIACGAAVVATRVGALPEVLGDAAVLVAPGDVDALARALRELLGDRGRRAELAAAGSSVLQRLSWEETAARTVDVYRSVGVPV
ncbi:MAG: glycosyltransferase family 4 protein [Acidimicrobiia bacterium]